MFELFQKNLIGFVSVRKYTVLCVFRSFFVIFIFLSPLLLHSCSVASRVTDKSSDSPVSRLIASCFQAWLCSLTSANLCTYLWIV